MEYDLAAECMEKPILLDVWARELFEILGYSVSDFDGWGECYGAGLSPAQAVECRDKGAWREAVFAHWPQGDVTRLTFGR